MAFSSELTLSGCYCSVSAKAIFLKIKGDPSNQYSSRKVTKK